MAMRSGALSDARQSSKRRNITVPKLGTSAATAPSASMGAVTTAGSAHQSGAVRSMTGSGRPSTGGPDLSRG